MSPLSTARALAYLSSGLLVSMMLLTLTTGVAQEPFEVVRPLAEHRALMVQSAPTLRVILSIDALFIMAYTGFFVAYTRVVEAQGARDFLRLGLRALLATAFLDIVEDQQLFALSEGLGLGEVLDLGTLRAQQMLSQTKFHLSYVGLFLFGLGLPRRDALERAFAFAVAVPVPLLGAFLWIAPPSLEMPLSVARWLGFLFGFAGAVVLLGRATGAARGPASATGAPA
jgi:hypothetical protein